MTEELHEDLQNIVYHIRYEVNYTYYNFKTNIPRDVILAIDRKLKLYDEAKKFYYKAKKLYDNAPEGSIAKSILAELFSNGGV